MYLLLREHRLLLGCCRGALVWHSGCECQVLHLLEAGNIQHFYSHHNVHGLYDEQLSGLDEDLDLLITVTATHGHCSHLMLQARSQRSAPSRDGQPDSRAS
jgi:hypothetical protein